MKKKMFTVLGIVLFIGVILSGCASYPAPDIEISTEPTKFEGKWTNLNALALGWKDFTYTFTGNQMLFVNIKSGRRIRTGYFTFTDTEITFISGDTEVFGKNLMWAGYTQKYTLKDGVLILEKIDDRNPFGPFTKQY